MIEELADFVLGRDFLGLGEERVRGREKYRC